VLFQPYAPISTPLLGFKTITFTKDSLLSPYNCLRKLTGIKLKYHRFPKQRRTLFLQHSNHGKALTVYPYVFSDRFYKAKASLQFRYLKQSHLLLNSLLIRYKIFLFEFQPFNVDKFIGNWHHINIADCLWIVFYRFSFGKIW
jgi:hypothetical protein